MKQLWGPIITILLCLFIGGVAYSGWYYSKPNPATSYTDFLFFWTTDSTTFDGDDYSGGDSTPITVSGAVIETSNQQVGTGCVDAPTTGDHYIFDPVEGTDIMATAEGGIGFWWYDYDVDWDNYELVGFRLSDTGDGTKEFWLISFSDDTLQLHWEDGTNDWNATDTSPPTVMTFGTWYFIEVCWKTSTNYIYMAVNNEEHVNSTANAMVTWTPDELLFGVDAKGGSKMYIDNIMISDDSTRCTAADDFYSHRNDTTSPR